MISERQKGLRKEWGFKKWDEKEFGTAFKDFMANGRGKLDELDKIEKGSLSTILHKKDEKK